MKPRARSSPDVSGTFSSHNDRGQPGVGPAAALPPGYTRRAVQVVSYQPCMPTSGDG